MSVQLSFVGDDKTDLSKVVLKKNGAYLRTSRTVWAVAEAILAGTPESQMSADPRIIAVARGLALDAGPAKAQLTQPKAKIEVELEAITIWLAHADLLIAIIKIGLIPALVINVMFLSSSSSPSPLTTFGPSTAALTAGAMFVIMAFHELAHAAIAVRYGCRAHKLGIGFFFVLPVFYADVSEIWRLTRAERQQVNIAGIAVQLVIGAAMIVAEPLMPAMINVLWQTIIWANIASIVLNLLPFAKLDGYWLLSDWSDIADLHSRTTKTIRSGFIAPATKGLNRVRSLIVIANAATALGFYAFLTIVIARKLFDLASILVAVRSTSDMVHQIGARPLTWLLGLYGIVWMGRQLHHMRRKV